MPISIKMPALSPAMDEGTITAIAVAEGTEGVKVGTVSATLAGDDEDASAAPVAQTEAPNTIPPTPARPEPVEGQSLSSPQAPAPEEKSGASTSSARTETGVAAASDRVIASPLAKRIAAEKGIDLTQIKGTGPGGRIVKADVDSAKPGVSAKAETAGLGAQPAEAPSAKPAAAVPDYGIPFEASKLNNIRKTIARRLTEAKQTIPHIYLTVDVQLDALLKLRGELNAALEKQGVKLSVNDLIVKALAKALVQVPKCNVSFAGDELRTYSRADISVAVAAPSGLITPIIVDAGNKSVSAISTEMKALAAKAREGKFQPHEFQGGTATLSNLGMFGIKQFDAVINPPQAMILAVGADEPRPYVVDGALAIATVMSATGSFDHRAIDGADGAELMQAFKALVEAPLALVA